ncbi:unnamed protein product, partial [Hymenolepis diminuta]
ISHLNKLVVYQKRSLRSQVHSLNLHFAKFCSDRSIIQLKRSLAALGQSAVAAEFRGQDLRTACEEMLLSKQLCVPKKCRPRRTYSVGDLVYALTIIKTPMHKYHNHQAAVQKYLRHGDRKGYLILQSQTTQTKRFDFSTCEGH